MCPPSQYHTDHFTALNLLCAPPTQPFLSQPLPATLLYTVPMVSPLSRGHMFGMTQYVALSYRLLSLSSKDLRSFRVFLWLPSTSFKLNPHCLDVPRSVYPLISCGTSWLLLNLAVMNKAAVNICVWILV